MMKFFLTERRKNIDEKSWLFISGIKLFLIKKMFAKKSCEHFLSGKK